MPSKLCFHGCGCRYEVSPEHGQLIPFPNCPACSMENDPDEYYSGWPLDVFQSLIDSYRLVIVDPRSGRRLSGAAITSICINGDEYGNGGIQFGLHVGSFARKSELNGDDIFAPMYLSPDRLVDTCYEEEFEDAVEVLQGLLKSGQLLIWEPYSGRLLSDASIADVSDKNKVILITLAENWNQD